MRGGPGFVDGPLAATWRPREGAETGRILARVGITVSSKVGGAVVRNRVKRKLLNVVEEMAIASGVPDCWSLFMK